MLCMQMALNFPDMGNNNFMNFLFIHFLMLATKEFAVGKIEELQEFSVSQN